MCGILCLIQCHEYIDTSMAKKCLDKLIPRGPDKEKQILMSNTSIMTNFKSEIYMGFRRLAIMDKTDAGLQPFSKDGMHIICNGEIYNWEELLGDHKIEKVSDCDCQVILPLYNEYGFHGMINELDAEFAMVLYDETNGMIYAARDRFGVRPLFYGYNNKTKIFGFASELKALHDIMEFVSPVKPSDIMTIDLKLIKNLSNETDMMSIVKINSYYDYSKLYAVMKLDTIDYIHDRIRELLTTAVEKRLHADRPIGFLLSGGLDSSLVVAIACKILGPEKITCFTMGLDDSPDVVASKKVTEFLGIKNHHIAPFSIDLMLNTLPEVIQCIESYDITTIRASLNQLIMAKYIREKTDIKVILSGEGSDEISGSYRFFKNAPDMIQFHQETIRLLEELYMFDNLRTDRTMSDNGLEVRVPFLDYDYVEFITRINPELLMFKPKQMEKQIVRDSFKGYLPDEILYRSKEAFSDAVNTKEVNWFRVLEKKLETEITDEELANSPFEFNKPQTKEALHYRRIFNEFYPGRDNVIAHYWLPKWCGNVVDPSATILNCY